MLKATKLTLAAALLAGSCGLAMAQGGGAGAGSAGGAGSDRQPSTEAHPGGNPTSGTATAPMKQKDTGMQTPTSARGQETGTAPDSAGTGAMHKAPGTNNQK
jgi:hypothetical protein